MEAVMIIVELFKYVLPSMILLGGLYIFFDKFLKKEERKERYELRLMSIKQMVPLRLQAYERAVLFLERLNPENLLLRLPPQNLNSSDYRRVMISEIQKEYEHNLSQQLYMTFEAWESLKLAKDQTLSLINTCQKELEKNDNDFKLAQLILEKMMHSNLNPSLVAIQVLKVDIQKSLKLLP